MTARDIRFGFNGEGRALAPNGAKKVEQGVITKQYALDTLSIQRSREALQCSPHAFTKYTSEEVFHFKQDEVAFYVKGSPIDAVRTSVNGLDAQFSKYYPNNPEMVRALLEEIIVPIGFVEEDVDPRKRIGYVALQVGGSKSTGAPGVYNFDGGQIPHIRPGVGVCFVPPNLVDTHQYGNEASGVAPGKVLLVARPANTRSVARRIMTVVSEINNDSTKFRDAMQTTPKLVEKWTRTACAIEKAMHTSMLLGLYVLLKNDIVQVAPSAAPVLESGANAPGTRDYAETVTTRIAELLGVIKEDRISAQLSKPQSNAWKKLAFDLRQTLFLVPHAQSNRVNAKYEFGFKRLMNGENISIGRNEASTRVSSNAYGQVLSLQLGYLDDMLQRICEVIYAEREKQLGVAHSSPTIVDTGIFQMFIQPRGGLARVDC